MLVTNVVDDKATTAVITSPKKLGPVNTNGFIVAGGHFSARRGRMSVV